MAIDLFAAGALRWLRDYLNAHPGAENLARFLATPVEAATKKTLFGCQSCGQCLLHHNGLTCPMRCPKNIRNGPCGGVRANGHCEVYAERWCVWYLAYRRSQQLPLWRESMFENHPAVNWELVNSSSGVNWVTGRDVGIKTLKTRDGEKTPGPRKDAASG